MHARRTSRPTYAFLIPLTLSILIAGCALTRHLKDGARSLEQGDPYEAALSFLEVLALNGEHKKGLEGLASAAEPAYKQKLSEAESSEQEKEFERALGSYRELRELLSNLKRFNVLSFETVDVGERIALMRDAAALQHYNSAESAFSRKEWSKAIGRYERALSQRSGFKDSEAKIGAAYYLWAQADEGEGSYRDAADHYLNAVERLDSKGAAAATKRAAEIYEALGNHFLTHDACRKAAADFDRALALSDSPELASKLGEAEACAVTLLKVESLGNDTGGSLPGMALEHAVADAASELIREQSSKYLRLVRSYPELDEAQGRAYLVTGRFTTYLVEEDGPYIEHESTEGVYSYDCTKTRDDGSSYRSTCRGEADVHYKVTRASVSVRLSGSLVLVDARTDEEIEFERFDFVARDEIEFASEFVMNGREIRIEGRNSDEASIAQRVVNLATSSSSLSSVESLLERLVPKVAAEASSLGLEVADQPVLLDDPDALPSF